MKKIMVLLLLLFSVYNLTQAQNVQTDEDYNGEIGDFLPCVLTFQKGQSKLNPSHMNILSDVATFLKNHPNARIVIVGSAQGEGGSGQNVAKDRAMTVKKALINRYKINPSRLIANMCSFAGSIDDTGFIKHFTSTSDAVVFYEQGFTVLDEVMALYEEEANRKLQPIAAAMLGYMLSYDCPACDGTGYVNGYKCDRCSVEGKPTGIDAKRSLEDGMKIAGNIAKQSRQNGNNKIKINTGNNGWQIKRFDEGIYEGHLVNGKRNGWGMIIYLSGECYTGKWKNDKITERGMVRKRPYRMSTRNLGMLCDREAGVLNNGKLIENRAVLRWNGTIYVGNLKNDQFNGYGQITDNSGSTLKTTFMNGKPGKGTCNNGLMGIVEGDFSQCDLNTEIVHILSQVKGTAKYIYSDGGYYYGHLKKGFPDGKGTIKIPNGDELEAWFDGNNLGRLDDSKVGIAKYKNGDIYVGYGGIKPEGDGTMYYFASHKYVEGKWSRGQIVETIRTGTYTDNDLKKGKKTKKYSNGDVYTGAMEYGLPNGVGTYTYANGNKLRSHFEFGKSYGTVILTYANGETYTGELKDGKMNGTGIYNYTNGDVYVGDFKEGKRSGQGLMRYSNKKYVVGFWKNDELGLKTEEGKWSKKDNGYEYKVKKKW